METKQFKVIIIGAGPAGLTAAHALGLAGIDFLVLESKPHIFEDVGASLVLSPPSMRVMQQLGLFDALQEVGHELHHSKSFTLDGYAFRDNTELEILRKNHGTSLVAFHRAHLLQVIYDGLPESSKQKIHFGKKLSNIASSEDGIIVYCADNSTYEGSIVIGADGVHSKTRLIMRQLAQKANPGIPWDPESPFSSSYKCLWCSIPRLTAPGESFDTQHKDSSVMYITGRERSWVFLYKKLPMSTQERTRFSEEDIEAFAKDFMDYPVTSDYKVKDLFHRKLTVGMSNLEEGVLKHWSFGRVVLVGDACHKFTPNAGLGFNNGVQDVVALCNGLQEAVSTAPGGQISEATLGGVFEAYGSTRRQTIKTDASFSAYLTRSQAWENMFYFFASRYLSVPQIVDTLTMEYLSRASLRHGLILNYVAVEERLSGKVNWIHGINPSE